VAFWSVEGDFQKGRVRETDMISQVKTTSIELVDDLDGLSGNNPVKDDSKTMCIHAESNNDHSWCSIHPHSCQHAIFPIRRQRLNVTLYTYRMHIQLLKRIGMKKGMLK
jgi:hypothetical protein